jgi:hypothetical protein
LQDQWTLGRWTLNLGVRDDWYYGWVPEQSTPGDTSKWPGAPERNDWLGERTFAAVKGVPSWMDLNPRIGAAYDIFGNGRSKSAATSPRRTWTFRRRTIRLRRR